MPHIVFTANLRPYTGDRSETDVPGESVRELLRNLEEAIPGIRHYLVNDQGGLRRHVNIFVDGEGVTDRAGLGDTLTPDSTVHIMQALSGG